jgi:anti-sigma factor (TIGR02949 family)
MKHGISCSEMIFRLDDYVDRALSPTELESVERHLLECVACAQKFSFELSLMETLRQRLHRITVPEDLLGRIREQLGSDQVG